MTLFLFVFVVERGIVQFTKNVTLDLSCIIGDVSAVASLNSTTDESVKLTPTEYLIVEVLAARWRLGEASWPFPKRLRFALRKLRGRGMIWFKSDIVQGQLRVGLTEIGRDVSLIDEYISPLEAKVLSGVGPFVR